ncbi:uncharacterized protein LOC100576528 isoform X3 [Apis mellifera]|uniref:Uncharacterized protein LOC100576528 isoform X3 n=1 Tax=Apis mellifera TaxID=7460 RepID=A0A7M7MLM1_APIME|nr:uncharacterized protein LOC100576528 isoform X3 [Apis mellifera]|eukprot:XP_026297777.1 uncharacterized protein LOC100576528 isoform X3 [Apis mellifera]
MTFGTSFHTEKSQFVGDNPTRPSTMAAEEGALSGGLGAKLKCPTPISRLRVEKIEGGLMVAGVVIAANCQIALPAFGFLFMLVGAVLTGDRTRRWQWSVYVTKRKKKKKEEEEEEEGEGGGERGRRGGVEEEETREERRFTNGQQLAVYSFGHGFLDTAASYRGPGEDEDKDSYAARIAFTGNSRILGPICIVVGALMLALGVLLCMLTRRARRRERRVGFHCPLHGDFYPVSPVQGVKMLGLSGKNVSGWSKIPCLKGRSSSKGSSSSGGHVGPPQCPHSVLSSTRSSVSSSPLSPCPTPMPFLVTSGSVSSGMVQSVGANLSPDQTFGSIRSLSVTREVASFPLSRTPTPPPQHRSSTLTNPEDLVNVGSPLREASPRPEVRVVAPAHRPPSVLATVNNTNNTNNGSANRKSVSILLPEHSSG